jgi:hypothetical protein
MIAYPKQVHVTLPSVEGFNGTFNITRDPPKGIYTRYNPKVGVNNNLLDAVGGSGDRVCDTIQKYARGINPAVAVDYSNYGTNGGAVRYRYGSTTANAPASFTQNAPKYAYRILQDGAFRPPVLAPTDLLPLSRMPRPLTNVDANKHSLFSNIAPYQNYDAAVKTIRDSLLQYCVNARPTFNLEKVNVPSEIDTAQAIKALRNPRNVVSNKSDSIQSQMLEVQMPQRGITYNTSYTDMKTNSDKSNSVILMPEAQMFSRSGVHEIIHADAHVNKSDSSNAIIFEQNQIPTNNLQKANYNNVVGPRSENRVVLGTDIEYVIPPEKSRVLKGSIENRALSNQGFRKTSNEVVGDTCVKLAPKVSAGGFNNVGHIPRIDG